MKSNDFLDPELSLGLQYQKRGPKRKMFSNEPCRVCGEPATGFNYRVVSCNACKGTGFEILLQFSMKLVYVPRHPRRKRLVHCDEVKCLMESIKMNEHHDY